MATHTETPADKEEKAKEIWVNTVIQVYMSRKWASVLSFFFFSAFHKQRGKKFPNTSLVNISGIRGLFSSTLGQKGFPSGSVVKSLPADTGDTREESSIPGLGRSLGEGNGSPLQCSCLENSMDRGPWWVAKMWLSSCSQALNQKKFILTGES